MGNKDFKVPALEKGLLILEVLSSAAEPMSLTDICQALGKNPSELYRMIGFLEERGYIIKEPHSGHYFLSLKLYELSHMHSPVDQLIKAASIPMRALALSMKESCHLSVLYNGDLLVLYQQESPEKYRFSVEVGAKYNALTTVSGRLLLSRLSADMRGYYLDQNPLYRDADPEEKQRIEDDLRQLAEQVFAVSEQETHLGITDYSILAGSPKAGLEAALTIPSLLSTRKPNREADILAALRTCASSITKAMGLEKQTT
ncbi:IclR family transcriptional regulator [Paenibacillus sp. HB172176]|uniref:IclR family transcriptional regulator n=1 Tax=Paenibacillus sp. HB172176 TaxID=2493690 RepID=UPI00143BB852|nr:IclR family transcriptional regulator [Paenibacillus sp. HB172176]